MSPERPSDLRVGRHTVTDALLYDTVERYARYRATVVRYYDCAGADRSAAASDGVDLPTLGRLAFIESSFRDEILAALIDAAPAAPWQAVPANAELVDADPGVEGGLYDAAEALHRHFLDNVPRLDPTTLSKFLHLTRPALFPILDSATRRVYDERAQKAWQDSRGRKRPFSGRSFWPVIREDVMAAEPAIDGWRTRLRDAADPDLMRVATLSDVRIWHIAVQAVGGAVA